jgi:hypothetical protein
MYNKKKIDNINKKKVDANSESLIILISVDFWTFSIHYESTLMTKIFVVPSSQSTTYNSLWFSRFHCPFIWQHWLFFFLSLYFKPYTKCIVILVYLSSLTSIPCTTSCDTLTLFLFFSLLIAATWLVCIIYFSSLLFFLFNNMSHPLV